MAVEVALRALSPEERRAVEDLARSRTAEARTVERARIVLAAAQGRHTAAVARDLGVSRPTVSIGIKRFNLQGTAGGLHRRLPRRDGADGRPDPSRTAP